MNAKHTPTLDLLRAECNHFVNGFCQTYSCLRRGGYPDRKDNPTCMYREVVRVVNSHDALVEALEGLVDQAVWNELNTGKAGLITYSRLAAARAALAAAKGGDDV